MERAGDVMRCLRPGAFSGDVVRDGDEGVSGREKVESGGVGEFGDFVGGVNVEDCIFTRGGMVVEKGME